MADVTMVDYRRTDLRKNVLSNPYWITSSEMVGATCQNKAAVLFSFPTVSRKYIVLAFIFQVTTVFTVSAGAASVTVGLASLLTDTASDVATTIDADSYILNADITLTTAAYYMPTTTNTSTWLTSQLGCTVTNLASQYITGIDAAVKCVAAYFACSAAGSILTGKARVHMLISEVPGF
jgi:hypothetical protein